MLLSIVIIGLALVSVESGMTPSWTKMRPCQSGDDLGSTVVLMSQYGISSGTKQRATSVVISAMALVFMAANLLPVAYTWHLPRTKNLAKY